MAEVLVVGAGRSGLLASRALARRGVAVTLVERLPEAGGQEPEKDTAPLIRDSRRAGVAMLLGTFAVEFRDGRLSTLGVQGADVFRPDVLVVATGSRPSTRAELQVAGDRGAGVLPGSVAHHWLDSGVLPGHHPVVVGDGQLARHLCAALLGSGARTVTSVRGPDATGSAPWPGVICYPQAQVESVHGFPRVTHARLRTPQGVTQVNTDAVILAAHRIPMRNIEGALAPSDRVVECFSSADPKTFEDAANTAEEACRRVASLLA